ncbi:MAG: MFS transporter [Phycisphaerae bacterium]
MNRDFSDIPFKPSSLPFFYGWVIVGVGAVGVVMSVPGQTIGVGVFTESLSSTLDVSRNTLSRAFLFGTLVSSILLPFAGTLIDRFGGRVMAVLSALMLGLACFAMSELESLMVFAGKYGMSFVTLCGCFLFLRFAGQGCLAMSSRVTMARWFEHRRGIAASLSGVIVSFGFNIYPEPVGEMVKRLGWSQTYLIFALIVGVGMSLLALIFFRDNPEQCGLHTDGANYEKIRSKTKIHDVEYDFTKRQAIKTYEFWIYTIGMSLSAMILTAVSFSTESIGAAAGLTASEAFGLYLPMSMFSVASNLIGGYVSDHVKMKPIFLLYLVSLAIGIYGIANWRSPCGRFLFVAGFGTSRGLFNMLRNVAWPRFFGRKHLGAVNGLTSSMIVMFTSIGPWGVGKFQEISAGSYRPVFLSMTALPVVLFVLALFTGNPQDKIHT